ncbi:MAG: Holliday junction branch migration protein RuvA [Andreesenia angusta]|nr:Holliday junction branch migration protein RuvA [Andreesenia angusta]
MYEYIIGDIVEVLEDRIVLESNNIGFAIYTSNNTIENIESRENIKIRTYLSVREDDMTLYGFLTSEELDMFKMLQTVSKIGPKVAIGILSALRADEIKRAILFNDQKTLTKAPGIGAKTAQRMILELKDKINEEEIILGTDDSVIEIDSNLLSEGKEEAIEALVGLGYNRNEIYRAISKIDIENKSTEEILKDILVIMGR